ncbi:hypothetical protein ACSX1A_00485 [Pontibacter sp. MBLB2868]|uniref:hypothetical protein n=1 Tax=Pontibacter sp. MBLB2868 TaxID=3451555 RepID=UPI003F7501D9
MKQKDNFRTTKHEGDSLGEKGKDEKIQNKPAPEKVDKESEMTPKENEVYVDLEPDELHVGDEKPTKVKEEKKKKK